MFVRQLLVLSTLLLSALSTPTPNKESKSIVDWVTFHSLLEEADLSAVHSVLNTLAPKFQKGVFEKDRTAIEQVHSEDPSLASKLVNIAKRQTNTTTTSVAVVTTTTTPIPSTTTTTPTTTSDAVTTTTTTTTTPPTTAPTTTTTTTTPASSAVTTTTTTRSAVTTTSKIIASSTSAASISSSKAAASSSKAASISSEVSSQIAATSKPPPTTVKVAPTGPSSAIPIATISNAIVYSTFGGGLVTITSSPQVVSFQPSTQTHLAYTTLPNGDVQTSTDVVVVNAPITAGGGAATQTAGAASTTGSSPGLQNAAGAVNLDFVGGISVMLAGAVALIMLTL